MRALWIIFTLLASSLSAVAEETVPKADPLPAKKGAWTEISGKVLSRLEADGTKPAWPGKTAGITADPVAGDVYMVIAGVGIWKSADHGETFARSDAKHIGGRCETGAALQFDPKGKRLACFMLDGLAGLTIDGGESWTSFANVGRNWDYGAVDWSSEKPASILTMRHESGGELYLTTDAGQKWNKVAKDAKYNSVGIFDSKTLITSKTDGGILRSTDAGSTWSKVADYFVTNHVMTIYKDIAYLITKEGLIASSDQGVTWTKRGAPLEATLGPIFKDEKHLIAWGKKGIMESTDGGGAWTVAAPLPEDYGKGNAEWFVNVGWDTKADIFYASRMSMPAYRWER